MNASSLPSGENLGAESEAPGGGKLMVCGCRVSRFRSRMGEPFTLVSCDRASNSPAGDQSRCCTHWPRQTTSSCPPVRGMTTISDGCCQRKREKAIRLPVGDQTGAASDAEFVVK